MAPDHDDGGARAGALAPPIFRPEGSPFTRVISDRGLRDGVSVVVPVYNSERTLESVAREVGAALADLPVPYELILVNDGSADRSWEVVRRLAATDPHVRGVCLLRNFGQHNALLCGVRCARYAVTVTIDDDLQQPPREIPRLLRKLDEGFDLVYAAPESAPHSKLRDALSGWTKAAIARATGIRLISDQTPFRAVRTRLRGAFEDYRSTDVLLDVLLSWGTSRVGTITARYEPRRVGASNYNLRRFVNMVALLVTGYSTTPLRLASIVGFFFFLFGMGVLAYVLITYFARGSLPGFPFLASLISILSGAQLFALGVFGEYLAGMFRRSLDRPTYVVADLAGAADPEQPPTLD